eukprot:COSAG02_NODE_11429_length_1725_cov_1.270603_2_plen_65_part_00
MPAATEALPCGQREEEGTADKKQGDIAVGRLEQWATASMPALGGADFIRAELPDNVQLPDLPLV